MKFLTIILAMLLLVGTVMASPLSVIESSYLNFDPTIAGPVWLLNVRGDNDASYVVFGDNEDISDTVDGDVAVAKEDFALVHSIESETCEYNLIGSAERNDVYQYEIDQVGSNIFFTAVGKFYDECYDSGGTLAWGTNEILGTGLTQDVWCLRKSSVPIARVGVVDEGKINFKAKFSLKKGADEPIIQQITSLASNADGIPSSIVFSDGQRTVARIRWIGGSTFGETCPGQDDVVAVETSGGWFTADKFDYIEYNDAFTELEELSKKIVSTDDITSDEKRDLERLVSAVNERGTKVLSESKIGVDGSFATITGSKAVVKLPRDHLIYAPDFQILLSTDWLGITFLSSKPKIVDSGFNSCSEEGDNSFYATVENIGNQKALFEVGATCQSGISISATTRKISLDPGERGTVTIPFSLDLSSDATKSCTVQVSDAVNIDLQDRVSISTSCKATTFCTVEGNRVCFGEEESICQDSLWVPTGSDSCSKSICNRDNVCDEKESFEICGGKLSEDNDCSTCNLNTFCDATETVFSCAADCGPPKPPVPTSVYVIGGVIVAGLAFFGLKQIKPVKGKSSGKSRKKGRKKK
jgi:hypothetical protein